MANASAPAKKSSTPARIESVEDVDAVEVLAEEVEESNPTVTVRDQVFNLREKIPGFILLRLSAAADAKTSMPKQMSAMLQFVEHAVVRDEQEAFEELLIEADPEIEIEEMSGIVEAMVEAITSRPT